MIAAVCGGRHFYSSAGLRAWLDGFHAAAPISELHCGGEQGCDRLAVKWALDRGVTLVAIVNATLDITVQTLIAFEGGDHVKNMVFSAWDVGVKVCFPFWDPGWARGLTGHAPVS